MRDSIRTVATHQPGDVPANPAPGPVSAGALSGAKVMETLKIEIVNVDGAVVQVVELPDPRAAFVQAFNELGKSADLIAVAH